MRKLLVILFSALAVFFTGQIMAQDSYPPTPAYQVGTVVSIAEEQQFDFEGQQFYAQLLTIRTESGEVVHVDFGTEFQPLTSDQRLKPGDQIVLAGIDLPADPDSVSEETGQLRHFAIADMYRLPALFWLLLGFFAVVAVVSGVKGLLSIVGMLGSLGLLTYFVLPMLLSGANPVMVTLLAAFVIALVTVYLSHGFKLSSHIALTSMLGTLVVVTLLSHWYVILAKLTGLGTEEAAFLQFGETATINLRGLLLGGMMLGALGVLDDITISQVSTVFEIKRANNQLPFSELYQRGMRVGRDHVASLVNTLVLAYAGANLPLLILFTISSETPAWVHTNNELIAEEVVRTIVGSLGLVLAVPLTTALAAYWVEKSVTIPEEKAHSH
jgi:uncharacterized membrane protein